MIKTLKIATKSIAVPPQNPNQYYQKPTPDPGYQQPPPGSGYQQPPPGSGYQQPPQAPGNSGGPYYYPDSGVPKDSQSNQFSTWKYALIKLVNLKKNKISKKEFLTIP